MGRNYIVTQLTRVRDVPRGERLITTGAIARALSVSPRTVAKWIDAGELRGVRIHLTRDRRVTAVALLEFCESRGVPVPSWLAPRLAHFAYGLRPEDPKPKGYEIHESPVALGWAIAIAERVGTLILGDGDGISVALQAAACCREHHPTSRVVFVLSEDVTRDVPGVVYRRPVDWDAVLVNVAFPTRGV